MSRAFAPPRREGFTASGLRRRARALHRPRIALLNPGWLCAVAAFGLTVLGIVTIGTVPAAEVSTDFASRQITFFGVAIVVAALTAIPHYRWLQRFSTLLMIGVLLLLVFVLLPFVPDAIVHPRNGARRWINVVVTDFQPSELAKIAYVASLASYLRYRKNYRRFLGLLLPFLLTLIPMGLVVVEPDLGTAMLFVPALLTMLIAAGAKLRHLLIIIVLGLALAPLTFPVLKDHQQNRIRALISQFKGDQRYVQGIGYQGDKAMTLVGSGQVTGVGRQMAANLVAHNHLPERHNDMVFAVVACRWGMVGALVTWGLFGLCCVGGLLTAAQCKDPFGRLVAVGIVAILFAQMVINTGMTIGLMPITGMTLPFVSYGGSSLVTAWIMIGILLNIGLRRPLYLAREAFEFDGEDEG